SAETYNLESSSRQITAPGHLALLLLQPPDLAGRVVAVDVGPAQGRESLTAVDQPAGQRPRLGVRVLQERPDVGRRAELAVGVEGVAAPEDAPAVVGAAAEQVDHLPEVLADIADVHVSRDAVDAHPPGVAQAEGVQLGPGVLQMAERVVLRDRVTFPRV